MFAFEDYTVAYWGTWAIIATVLVQALIGSTAKAAQQGAIPGKIDNHLSHSSFVFRSHRTFMNSIENIPTMLGTIFLAIFAVADPFWVTTYIWLFALTRIIHMCLYYAIATEKNPSPRSYFFLIGLGANIGLLALCAMALP